jgi:hypothetical protein
MKNDWPQEDAQKKNEVGGINGRAEFYLYQ